MFEESPYTYSRARVLLAYRRYRRSGIEPAHAMEAVLTAAHRTLAHFPTAREEAMAEWDREHARRYLGIIDIRKTLTPYWGHGKVKA